MYTKSKIQMIKENQEYISNFIESLNNIMNKYLIEDSIFSFNGNQLFEVTKGYFETIKEYSTLKEALYSCDNFNNLGIRIVNNDKFMVGYIRRTISECNEGSNVFDIDRLVDIR